MVGIAFISVISSDSPQFPNNQKVHGKVKRMETFSRAVNKTC